MVNEPGQEDLTNIETKAMLNSPKKSQWIRKIEGKTKWRDKRPILPEPETDFPPYELNSFPVPYCNEKKENKHSNNKPSKRNKNNKNLVS